MDPDGNLLISDGLPSPARMNRPYRRLAVDPFSCHQHHRRPKEPMCGASLTALMRGIWLMRLIPCRSGPRPPAFRTLHAKGDSSRVAVFGVNDKSIWVLSRSALNDAQIQRQPVSIGRKCVVHVIRRTTVINLSDELVPIAY